MSKPESRFKYKWQLMTAAALFLAVNTQPLWIGQLGTLAMASTLLLVFVFLIVAASAVIHLYRAIRERFRNRQRVLALFVLAAVTGSTAAYPFGFIDYEGFGSEILLVAHREGVAGCMTTLKLKADRSFIEREACFGVTDLRGSYGIRQDTIFFRAVQSRDTSSYYEYAVIRKAPTKQGGSSLVLHTSPQDTTGYPMDIVLDRLH
jgi:hypothetical protein